MIDSILEPVYFIRDDRNGSKLYVAFSIDDEFGLASLNVDSEIMPGEPNKWRLRFKVFNGEFVGELFPKLSLFHGRIETTDVWRPRIVKCDKSKLILIQNWIKVLNG